MLTLPTLVMNVILAPFYEWHSSEKTVCHSLHSQKQSYNLYWIKKILLLPENLGLSKFYDIFIYYDKILWRRLLFRTKKSGNCLCLLCASLHILILLHVLYTKAFRSSYPTQRCVKLCLTVDKSLHS